MISPDLAAQRGIPQNKVPGEDLWDHTLRTVDATPADRPVIRLAALVHDIGKPATLADGHFHHHDVVGARLADELLRRLRYPRTAAGEVTHLVRHHMFAVDPGATDAAVRRFIKRIGRTDLDALFALRRADDIGSGMDPDDPEVRAYRARIDAEIAAEAALDRYALTIDGTDLMRELELVPGPRLGRVIDGLVEARHRGSGPQRARLAPAARTGHACRHGCGYRRHVIELLLQAERALTMGMLDQAERLYRQAASADPQNSIAVVGLARVALERDDDQGALREARRALAIDGENVAAARLAARLEEVMAYRGQAVPVWEAAAVRDTVIGAEDHGEPKAGAAEPGPTDAEPGASPITRPADGTTRPSAATYRSAFGRLLRRNRP